MITIMKVAWGRLKLGELCCNRKLLSLGACGFGYTASLCRPRDSGPRDLGTVSGPLGSGSSRGV